MANLTANARRPINQGTHGLQIFYGLLAAGVEAFQGAVLGKNTSGYYENALNTKGSFTDLAVVRVYISNVGGLDGAKEVQLEKGVHAFDTWSGTINKTHIGTQAIMGADNQTITRWDPASLPAVVNLGDGNSMSLQALRPGGSYRIVNEGISKPLSFREDKPGELLISIKTDGAGASHADNTGTIITAAVNASPIAGRLAKAAVLGTGATVIAVAANTTLSSPRLGEIVDVETDLIHVDSTK